MVMVDMRGMFVLYGIECTLHPETQEREDSLLVFSFKPENSDSPLVLLQRYRIKDTWAAPTTVASVSSSFKDSIIHIGSHRMQ